MSLAGGPTSRALCRVVFLTDACLTSLSRTDDRPTTNTGQIRSEATAVQNAYIYTIAVGVGNAIDQGTLRDISSAPQRRDETFYAIASHSNLDSVRGVGVLRLLVALPSGDWARTIVCNAGLFTP